MKASTSVEGEDNISEQCCIMETVPTQDASWPRISIITPSYNQGRFLERTILSVLDQNYPNLEYIIMDGGSTDGSVDIIRKYERCLAFWTSQKDHGQSDAIRKGFGRSTGRILAYLNSDDTYAPGTLLQVAQVFGRDPVCDLVFGNTKFIDADDNVIGECRFTKFHFPTLIYEGTNLHQPGAFWTRNIYEKVGGLNVKYRFCMDYDLFCRVGRVGRLRHIRSHLANFRVHGDSKTATILSVGRAEHEEIANRYRASNHPVYLRYRRVLCQLRRMACYVGQGDIDYAIKGMRRRLVRRAAAGASR